MYYNLLRNWQKPFTVEMYCNINLSCLLLRSQLGRSIAVICIPWLGLTRICGGRGGQSSEVLPHIASYLSPRRGRPSPNLGGRAETHRARKYFARCAVELLMPKLVGNEKQQMFVATSVSLSKLCQYSLFRSIRKQCWNK